MNKESTVEPEVDLAQAPPVRVLPGHLFFVDRIDLPTTLEDSEIEDFAELSLEGIAPFPIEQLYWGFIYSESASAILLYAAFKDRLHKLGHDDLNEYTWVLPDFATLTGAHFPEDTTVALEDGDTRSHLYYEAGQTLPKKVEFNTPATRMDTAHKSGPLLRIELESALINERGQPAFHFKAIERSSDAPGKWQQLSPPEEVLWRADIRDSEFKKNERNTRRLTKWVSRSTAYAMLFALLLLLLEGALYLGNIWVESQNTKIAEQAQEVRKIEDKQSLMNKLDQVAQNELRPIAILEALNQSRPQGIYFTDAIAEGQNRIRIEGVANTINELNAYTTSLSTSGKFILLEDPETNFSGGKTTFRANLSYIHNNEASSAEETAETG